MRSLKSISVLTLFFSMALFMMSCGGNADSHDHSDADHSHDATSTEAVHGEGKEYTSAYVCPMHCEGSGSDAAGTCPVCGMNYVAQEAHTEDGHQH